MYPILASRFARVTGLTVGAVVLAWLATLPWHGGTTNATLFTWTLMLTNVGVAINWNLTGGFTGYVDFGHAVWFGIGAYGTAITMSVQPTSFELGWPPAPAILFGALCAGLIAMSLGRATMRLKGAYFSIAMLGSFVAVRELVRVTGWLTGGGVGRTIPPHDLYRREMYLIELALVVVLIGFSYWLRRTQFGASLLAIRDDETGAEMRGIDTTRYKTMIFSISGFSTGIFGGLWAYQTVAIDPDTTFLELRTVEAVMGVMLGGIGTVLGPVLGAATLYWLQETLWQRFEDFKLLIQGILLILIVLFLPKGVIGLFDRRSTSLVTLWSKAFGRDGRDAFGDRDQLIEMRADATADHEPAPTAAGAGAPDVAIVEDSEEVVR